MLSLYWKIRYYLEDLYFKKKYAGKLAQIIYDRRFKCYVCPTLLAERSPNLTYVCSEVAKDGLYYGYKIRGIETHAHTLEELLIDAYNEAETFTLLDENELSQQELNLVNKLIAQGKQDRLQK